MAARNEMMRFSELFGQYEYGSTPLSTQIQTVIRIVLNTLNNVEHRCRPLPATLIMDDSTQRSRGKPSFCDKHLKLLILTG